MCALLPAAAATTAQPGGTGLSRLDLVTVQGQETQGVNEPLAM